MKLAALPELMTPNEISYNFRIDARVVRSAAKAGQVKCRKTVTKGGKSGHLIDVADARRLWGAT